MTDVLSQLRVEGARRCRRWHGPDTVPWTGSDWSNAMCGEAGEAANIVKKLRRHETGTGSREVFTTGELKAKLADELGDVIAYADLLAQHYGIDLRHAIADKFNVVSRREGFPERIDLGAPDPLRLAIEQLRDYADSDGLPVAAADLTAALEAAP